MKQAAWAILKTTAVWAALIAGAIAGGLIVTLPVEAPAAPDGPLSTGQALLATEMVTAILVSLLAARLPGPIWRRALILFALLYVAGSFLSDLESRYFGDLLNLPDGLLAALAVMNAVKFGLASIVAAAVWRPQGHPDPLPAGLWWRLAAIALLYVPVYFVAGYFIAWQSAAVRAFYGEGLSIDDMELALVQVGRGAIWAAVAATVAFGLVGRKAIRALLTGAAFAVVMAMPLLYPNGLMPWSVRSVHLVEILISNFLFGIAAMLILTSVGVERKNRQDAAAVAA